MSTASNDSSLISFDHFDRFGSGLDDNKEFQEWFNAEPEPVSSRFGATTPSRRDNSSSHSVDDFESSPSPTSRCSNVSVLLGILIVFLLLGALFFVMNKNCSGDNSSMNAEQLSVPSIPSIPPTLPLPPTDPSIIPGATPLANANANANANSGNSGNAGNGPLVLISGKQLKQLARQSQSDMLVAFLSKGCIHCQKVHPTLEEVAPKLRRPIYAVFADTDGAQDVLSEYQIGGFPTIAHIQNGSIIRQFEDERIPAKLILWGNAN